MLIPVIRLILIGIQNHIDQVQERLEFIQFILRDGRMWLSEKTAEKVRDEPSQFKKEAPRQVQGAQSRRNRYPAREERSQAC